MDDLTRREVLALATPAAFAAPADEKPRADMTDRERVIAAGLTEAEADCWELTAQLAGKLLGLPKLHVMDEHEIAHAIHVIQYRLLGRPAYRRYQELAKAKGK